jgi:hypothetical protein
MMRFGYERKKGDHGIAPALSYLRQIQFRCFPRAMKNGSSGPIDNGERVLTGNVVECVCPPPQLRLAPDANLAEAQCRGVGCAVVRKAGAV